LGLGEEQRGLAPVGPAARPGDTDDADPSLPAGGGDGKRLADAGPELGVDDDLAAGSRRAAVHEDVRRDRGRRPRVAVAAAAEREAGIADGPLDPVDLFGPLDQLGAEWGRGDDLLARVVSDRHVRVRPHHEIGGGEPPGARLPEGSGHQAPARIGEGDGEEDGQEGARECAAARPSSEARS
jgi:hypothetical protein